ncbi:Zn(2+)-responsive transcriptional regulator [Colwellia sp. D2M02]|uniref:Zn(2+)-responsive transcriptional regulator n=1 Tax=Colwellia asteriadis TaxID=517723 RepID=A0ABN1L4K0_9GAMM|nr:Zn(2+)-responsive transcriptional regulator [Colwellia sp. D2M02]MBU2893343.1 Zn(2+)-responsive transcriptional regulator [Colwellia sp. D2M02]
MYKIGDIAKQLGISADTLRYYEQHNLLQPAGRSVSGYRLYDEHNLQEMHFILQAKQVGFTLAEIAQLLSIRVDSSQYSCGDVKSYTSEKLQQVESKIAELTSIQKGLQRLVNSCCGGSEKAEHCSILSSLENDKNVVTR